MMGLGYKTLRPRNLELLSNILGLGVPLILESPSPHPQVYLDCSFCSFRYCGCFSITVRVENTCTEIQEDTYTENAYPWMFIVWSPKKKTVVLESMLLLWCRTQKPFGSLFTIEISFNWFLVVIVYDKLTDFKLQD